MTHRDSTPAAPRLGAVGLATAHMERSLGFYQEALGLTLARRDATGAALGAGGAALIQLIEAPGARPPPAGHGMAHLALRVPARRDLARLLAHLAAQGVPIQGVADHFVSESIYLADPDGNGLEITWDRPQDQWLWADGEVRIGTVGLDVADLLAARGDSPAPWRMPAGSCVGHLQLAAADLARAEAFYTAQLGFQVTKRFRPVASFLAQPGYHHHLGLRAGGGAGPPAAAGLRWWTLLLDPAGLGRLAAQPGGTRPDAHSPTGLVLRDPAGYSVRLRPDPIGAEQWAERQL